MSFLSDHLFHLVFINAWEVSFCYMNIHNRRVLVSTSATFLIYSLNFQIFHLLLSQILLLSDILFLQLSSYVPAANSKEYAPDLSVGCCFITNLDCSTFPNFCYLQCQALFLVTAYVAFCFFSFCPVVNVFDKDIRHMPRPVCTIWMQSELQEHLDRTKLFICKYSLIIDSQCHLLICCPLMRTFTSALSFWRSCSSACKIIPITIFIISARNSSLLSYPDKHTGVFAVLYSRYTIQIQVTIILDLYLHAFHLISLWMRNIPLL